MRSRSSASRSFSGFSTRSCRGGPLQRAAQPAEGLRRENEGKPVPTANSSPETSEPSQGRRRWPVRGTARAGHPATRHEANVSRVPWEWLRTVLPPMPAARAKAAGKRGHSAAVARRGRLAGVPRALAALSLLARPQRPPRSRPPSSRTTAVTVRRKEPAHGFRGEQHELISPDPRTARLTGEGPGV